MTETGAAKFEESDAESERQTVTEGNEVVESRSVFYTCSEQSGSLVKSKINKCMQVPLGSNIEKRNSWDDERHRLEVIEFR